MIKNVEFKTPNNDVLQGTNLARLYDDMSEKIVKESEDFEGRDSGWTLDEILRLEVRTNRYSPFRGSSSFIEVPKQIAETKAIINVINKKDSQCFMWSILAALYPNTSNPNKTSSYVPHLNKLNFDGISFPTPLNEQQERTTQLISRNETTQLNRRKQLNSSVGTKQLNSALPSTACNRLQPPATAYNRLQPPTACNRLQPPATAYNRPATANRLQPPATACTACTAFTAESAFSIDTVTYGDCYASA
ncbi:c2H2-type domain-containing protein [Trichonephila clavipes]|nr:c2H2-type domain-containing protein [Trichonephila clavipes]